MISSILKTSKLVEFITYVSYGIIIGKNAQVLTSFFYEGNGVKMRKYPGKMLKYKVTHRWKHGKIELKMKSGGMR